MKKLFAPFILFALLCMLLSSCSNTAKLSFSKRHYRSGNFVDVAGRNQTVSSSDCKIPIATVDPGLVVKKPENHLAVNTSSIILRKQGRSENRMHKDNPNGVSSNSSKHVFHALPNLTEHPILKTDQVISESVGSRGDSSGAGGAALSLLWIIIVIILILWLIGLLAGGFGLGGFINVLLIIALILLILWLLRVW